MALPLDEYTVFVKEVLTGVGAVDLILFVAPVLYDWFSDDTVAETETTTGNGLVSSSGDTDLILQDLLKVQTALAMYHEINPALYERTVTTSAP